MFSFDKHGNKNLFQRTFKALKHVSKMLDDLFYFHTISLFAIRREGKDISHPHIRKKVLSCFAFSIYSLLHCATILVLQRAVVKPQFYFFICQRVGPKMFRRHCGSSAARCWIKNGLAVETNKQLR